MSNLLSRDVKSMTVYIRWKYKDQNIEHVSRQVMMFVTLDCIDRKVRNIIKADSCYEEIEYAYWFNASGIRTYVKGSRS